MENKIWEIFARQLEIDADTITPDSLIIEDLGAHSLDIVEILAEIEDTFNVTIPDEDIPGFKTVSDIKTYLENHL